MSKMSKPFDPANYLHSDEERAAYNAELAAAELREAAYDYAHLIQVERYDRDDVAVHRAYERLRKALGMPVGLTAETAVDF